MIQRLEHRNARILHISAVIDVNRFRMQRIRIRRRFAFPPGRTPSKSALILLQYVVPSLSARPAEGAMVGTTGCRRARRARTSRTSSSSAVVIIRRRRSETRHEIRHHRRDRPRLKTRTQTRRPAERLGISQHQLQAGLSSQTAPHDARVLRAAPDAKFFEHVRMQFGRDEIAVGHRYGMGDVAVFGMTTGYAREEIAVGAGDAYDYGRGGDGEEVAFVEAGEGADETPG
mmetsp:Transcript_2673/g.5985  ORF Transcript_2673/g.5985 Transcript_2673/m.5985 type:complete len:230 (-) Transcript_2673:488-1177(-)